MNNSNQKVSNRLSREQGTNSTYANLLSRPGPLSSDNKKYSRDIFSLALAFGYEKGMRVPIETKDNFINKTNFGEILPSLINALAITKSEKGIEILAEDPSEIYRIAEEYANGGLEFLNSEYLDNTDGFIELLRLKLLDFNENNKIIDKLDELDL